MGLGQIDSSNLFKVFIKEMILAIVSGGILGLLAYPRVRYLYNGATDLDAFAISLCYAVIIVISVSIGVTIPALFSMFSDPAVSAPPTIMVCMLLICIGV